MASWLSDMDSNHDKGLQRALCYRYTIGQSAQKIPPPPAKRKEKVTPVSRPAERKCFRKLVFPWEAR